METKSKTLLIIPHLKIQNANAMSSPVSVGFPAMTAFMGAAHALQRGCNEAGQTVSFESMGVVSHETNVLRHKEKNGYVYSLKGMAMPMNYDKSRPAFIETARCDLDVTIVIECNTKDLDESKEPFLMNVKKNLHRMKFCAGDILEFRDPVLVNAESPRELVRYLMPGYVLVERRDLMIEAMKSGQDALDAMLDYLCIHHESMALEPSKNTAGDESDKNDDAEIRGIWRSYKKSPDETSAGWIVPIGAGFHGISGLGVAENQRDTSTPHRFAESLITLAEFKMPHRIDSFSELLWRYQFDDETNLYACTQLNN